ncbi:MAG: hypothetical protein WD990_10500 [Acidimicrobiia bacterium]
MKRFVMIMGVTVLLVVPAGMAAAGGWAVATLDTTPAGFAAGQTRQVEYQILQHGVHPVDVDTTEIRFFAKLGQVAAFPGKSTGEVGHYVAEVTMPESGSYRWDVTMGPFLPAQDLGFIDVGPLFATTGGPDHLEWMRIVFPIAAAVSAGALVLQTLAMRRRRGLDAA